MDEEIEVIGSPTGSYNKLSDGTVIKVYQDGIRKQAVYFNKNGTIIYASPIYQNVDDETLLKKAVEVYNNATNTTITPGTINYYNAILGWIANAIINNSANSNTIIYYEEVLEFCNIKRNNINDPITESNLSSQAQTIMNTIYDDYISKYDSNKTQFIIDEGINTKIESIPEQLIENIIAEGEATSDPDSRLSTDSSVVLFEAESKAKTKATNEVINKYLNGNGRVTIKNAPGNNSIEYIEKRVSDLKGTITKPYREAYVKIKCKVLIPKQVRIIKSN